VTNSKGESVCFLFQWGTFYNTAFYPETPDVADRKFLFVSPLY
jgi:hypothetical protein